jgi:hypothetical protein
MLLTLGVCTVISPPFFSPLIFRGRPCIREEGVSRNNVLDYIRGSFGLLCPILLFICIIPLGVVYADFALLFTISGGRAWFPRISCVDETFARGLYSVGIGTGLGGYTNYTVVSSSL